MSAEAVDVHEATCHSGLSRGQWEEATSLWEAYKQSYGPVESAWAEFRAAQDAAEAAYQRYLRIKSDRESLLNQWAEAAGVSR